MKKGKNSFFCQFCSRQFIDERSFLAHQNSRDHKKNVKNSTEDFDKRFRLDMIVLFKAKAKDYVDATQIYNEYMNQQSSVKVNATSFGSLSVFVGQLVKSGVLIGEFKEGAWTIKYQNETFEDTLNTEKNVVSDLTIQENKPSLNKKLSQSSSKKSFALKLKNK